MRTSGMSHIAFCVRDLDRSLKFYRDLLGMQVVFDEVQDITRRGLPAVYKYQRTTRRTVHLRYGDGPNAPRLVITSHPGDKAYGRPIKLDQVGISHFSFTVPDVKALAEELMAKGVKLAGPPDSFRNRQGEVSSIFVYDPDGILVQFDNGSGG
ncbi:MAG TPA: VOC family protein [Dehalococcoidia bacterium]|nr:VOC family protein [Dehalococcoidia bacterium]